MTAVEDPDIDFELDVRDELYSIIAARVGAHERSQQVEIGPSGLGTPCVRKLAHRLNDTPPVNDGGVPWRPTVGTAVHAWLAEMLTALNEKYATEAGPVPNKLGGATPCHPWCEGTTHLDRYLIEFEVPVGRINGRTIYGHVDFYDRARKMVGDWKIAGPKSLKDHHAAGMGHEYRVQAHTYGVGCAHAGYEVERIAVVFLPMNGELKDCYVLSEALDPAVRNDAFRRARIIESGLTDVYESLPPGMAGDTAEDVADQAALVVPELRAFFKKLKTSADYCSRCPWFSPGASDYEAACPGDKTLFAEQTGDRSFEGLL